VPATPGTRSHPTSTERTATAMSALATLKQARAAPGRTRRPEVARSASQLDVGAGLRPLRPAHVCSPALAKQCRRVNKPWPLTCWHLLLARLAGGARQTPGSEKEHSGRRSRHPCVHCGACISTPASRLPICAGSRATTDRCLRPDHLQAPTGKATVRREQRSRGRTQAGASARRQWSRSRWPTRSQRTTSTAARPGRASAAAFRRWRRLEHGQVGRGLARASERTRH